MKHTGSTLLLLLFLSFAYFVFPHSLQMTPKKASARIIQQKVTPKTIKPSPSPTPALR